MVKLVDHDIVEMLGRESLQVLRPGQSLHGGAKHVDLGIMTLPHVEADACLGPDADEGLRRLTQDLLAMGHEEDPTGTHARRIEGREPCLAQAGGEHYEPATESRLPGLGQRVEGFHLNGRGFWRRFLLLTARRDRTRRWHASKFVALDPAVAQRDSAWVCEEFTEPQLGFEEAGVTRVGDAVVPLQAVLQGLSADVAGADEGRTLDQFIRSRFCEDISLEVKAGALRGVDPDFTALVL